MMTEDPKKEPSVPKTSGASSDPVELNELNAAIAAVQSGDVYAYTEVVRATEMKVKIVLAAVLPSSSTIEDIAQEVFLTAYRKIDQFELGTDFTAWVKAIARNLALNERRRWIREQNLKQNFQADVEDRLAQSRARLSETVQNDMAVRLNECIEKLDPRFRELIRDFYFSDYSSKQVADRLGKTDAAVRLMLWRTRSALAECLRQQSTV